MKKFTKEIKMLLSTAIIGTTGIGLLTSCGDDYYEGGLSRTDDMAGGSSSVTATVGAAQAPDETISCGPDETTDTACVTTDEPPLMGEMAAPDEWVTTEAEKTQERIVSIELHPTEGVAMPD